VRFARLAPRCRFGASRLQVREPPGSLQGLGRSASLSSPTKLGGGDDTQKGRSVAKPRQPAMCGSSYDPSRAPTTAAVTSPVVADPPRSGVLAPLVASTCEIALTTLS